MTEGQLAAVARLAIDAVHRGNTAMALAILEKAAETHRECGGLPQTPAEKA